MASLKCQGSIEELDNLTDYQNASKKLQSDLPRYQHELFLECSYIPQSSCFNLAL
jgi:hypothetical protein